LPQSRTAHSATMDEAGATRPCHLFDRARKNEDEDISICSMNEAKISASLGHSFIHRLSSFVASSFIHSSTAIHESPKNMHIAAVLSEAISWCVPSIYWSPERKEEKCSIDVEPTTKLGSGLRWRWPWRESEILELPSRTSRPTSACITPSPPIDR